MSDDTFTIKPFPPIRQATIDLLGAASRKHMIHGLVEVDATKPRQVIDKIKQTSRESFSLNITVGGIVTRPSLVDGQLENREHLCLTISFDHDLIDGAPAARFIQRFKEFIESGSGLPEETKRQPSQLTRLKTR